MAEWPCANLSPRHRRGAGGAGAFPDLGAQVMNLPWLTILTLVPLFGGIIVAGLGAEQRRLARGLALAFSLVGLTGALCLWKHFNAASGDLQFVEKHEWVKSLGIDYFLGVDGLGLLMVMLTAIVVPLSILASGSMFSVPRPSPPALLEERECTLEIHHFITRWSCGCRRDCLARSPR